MKHIHPLRKQALPLILSGYLLLARVTTFAEGENSLSYKFQIYSEDDGRMEIPSHAVSLETSLPYDITFSGEILTNIMTGASPTGLMDPNNPGEIQLSEVEDQRWAYIFSATKGLGENHSVTFEYAYSEEDDYISDGFALRSEHQFNAQNTTLQIGLAYNDDDNTAIPLQGARQKENIDLGLGLTQLLTPKTILQANFTFGYSRGYLGDPYKSISQRETFNIPGFPPFSEDIPYFENRPDERVRLVFRLGLLQYVEPLNGSINTSYRLFQDDAGIRAHTLAVEWNQKMGDTLVLSPYYRFYHQGQADYYYTNLDDVAITPNDDRTGRAPFYSADYRVSGFDAHTYGLKLVYRPTDWLSMDVGYERYVMQGNDSVTPGAAYPKAHVLNLGLSAHF
ncbi:MAG: hypothetical protein ACI8T1_003355 [Verrucomicrobiales bacterium]|jgi:hypothetical protein